MVVLMEYWNGFEGCLVCGLIFMDSVIYLK